VVGRGLADEYLLPRRTYGGGFYLGGSFLDDGSLLVAQSVERVSAETLGLQSGNEY